LLAEWLNFSTSDDNLMVLAEKTLFDALVNLINRSACRDHPVLDELPTIVGLFQWKNGY